ncbi:MAG: acyl transferase, partial [Chitinophagaceae bacterium]
MKTGFSNCDLCFESSGTTGVEPSRHWVREPQLYRDSFLKGFRLFYGAPSRYCILGLLPSYLERQHSSLIYMVEHLQAESQHPLSGFYLYDHERLARVLEQLERQQQPTLLFGVTYALLDFAQQFPQPLTHTTLIETGGMKGRSPEWTRAQVHERLLKAFAVPHIHSEYGMTELLSQAYSRQQGIFHSPPWMKVLLRDEDDPFVLHHQPYSTGVINVIDLANLYSCSFIATEDVGRLHEGG